MTTTYHTPASDGGGSNSVSVFNAPMSQLDAALVAQSTRISALGGAGGVVTLANGLAATGQKVVTVDSVAGFVDGASVVYLVDGATLEANTIATDGVDSGANTITLANNIGGSTGISDDGEFAQRTLEGAAIATAGNYGGTVTAPTAADQVTWSGKNIYNVLAYGAIGDDGATTDNQVAFAATVSAASAGDVLVIPRQSGYFLTADETVIDKSLTLIIHGDVRTSDETKNVFKITASDVTVIFDGGRITGPGVYASDNTPPALIAAIGTSTAAPITNVHIRNPQLFEPASAGIWFHFCNDSSVQGGYIEGGPPTNIGTNVFAILNTDSTNIVINGVQYKQNSSGGAVAQFYNAAQSTLTEMRAVVSNCLCDGCWDKLAYQLTAGATITNNRVYGRASSANSGGIRVGKEAVVSGNFIKSCYAGSIQAYALNGVTLENVKIINNVIVDGGNSGIELGYYPANSGGAFKDIQIIGNTVNMSTTASTVTEGIRFLTSDADITDVEISGNTVINADLSNAGGASLQYGAIRVYPGTSSPGTYFARRLKVSGNTIKDCGSYGMRLYYLVDSDVSNNTIVDIAKDSSTTSFDALRLENSCVNTLVENNKIYLSGDGPTKAEHYDGAAYNGLDNAIDHDPSTNVAATIDATNDYLYIGNPFTFTRIIFRLGTYNTNAATLAGEYYNGSTWSAISGFADGTVSTGKTLAASAAMTFTLPADWAKTTIDGASLYWIRFRPSVDLTSVRFDEIRTAGRMARGIMASGAGIMVDCIVRRNKIIGATSLDAIYVGGDPYGSTIRVTMGGNTTTNRPVVGKFTMAGAAALIIYINSPWHATYSVVRLTPINAAAVALQAGASALYTYAITAGQKIEFRTADGGAAAGTETFYYEIVQ